MRIARIGVLLDHETAEKRWKYGVNVFEYYLNEILSHAGIPYKIYDHIRQIRLSKPDLLITALESDDAESTEALWKYAEEGGIIISYGGLRRLAKRAGCAVQQPTGIGYADVSSYTGIAEKLRYLRAEPWVLRDGSESAAKLSSNGLYANTPDGAPVGALHMRVAVGEGWLERFAIPIIDTIVQMQQGSEPVLRDGVPAADGTAEVDEGILKADDVIEQDWIWDRVTSEAGTPFFALPYADLWREVIVAHLLRTVASRGLTIPFVGYWPDGVTGVAMISHDSDANEDEAAEVTLDVLRQAQVCSTWCMMEPGYSPYIYEKVKEAGHELALHYNALTKDHGKWEEAEFVHQLDWLKAATGLQKVCSNKNHFTRFEGWGELFEWCEAHGVLSDQTRGPSKKGNVGFLFGTCHPYFPISLWDRRNRLYDVLEIGFLTQDMDIGSWADSGVIAPFLKQVKRVDGVAHFLFHQYHLYRMQTVRDAFASLIEQARANGFEFWTGKQINDWQRARRSVRIKGMDSGGNVIVERNHEAAPLAIWIPVPEGEGVADGAHTEQSNPAPEQTEIRFGVRCRKQVIY